MRIIATIALLALVALSTMAADITITEPTPVPGTIGAEVRPADLNVDEHRTVTVRNRAGGIVLDFAIETTGGYSVTPTSFTLAPDETIELAVAEVGEGEGRMTVVGTTAADQLAPGTVAASIALQTKLRHGTGLDLPWIALVLPLLVLVLVGLVWRRRRQAV